MGDAMEAHARPAVDGDLPSAAAYRAQMRRRLTLPSGAQVLVRRGSLLDFLYGGTLPAPVLAMLVTPPTGRTAPPTPDEMRTQIEAIDRIVCQFVVEPTVVSRAEAEERARARGGAADPTDVLAPHELGVWEMMDADKAAIVQEAMQSVGLSADVMAPFRAVPAEPAGDDGPVPAGQGVPSSP